MAPDIDIEVIVKAIVTTVPGLLIVLGFAMLLLNLTPLNAPASWGWALIIIGVLIYIGEGLANRFT